ncbi:MAG TPA: hypothetical protein VF950_18320 [Planctomycetota bacterium]
MIFVAGALEAEFKALNMLALPAPTELCIGIARLLRTPFAALLCAAAGGAGLVVTARGTLDARAKPLTIILAVADFGLICFFALALYLPITRLDSALSR